MFSLLKKVIVSENGLAVIPLNICTLIRGTFFLVTYADMALKAEGDTKRNWLIVSLLGMFVLRLTT